MLPAMRLPLLLLTALALLAAGEGASAARPAGSVAYIKIDGAIEPGRAEYFKQSLERAKQAKVATVVVHLTTDGGLVRSGEDMLKAALNAPEGMRLVAYVDNRAYSAGSLIAYGHHEVWLAPSATIGDVGVIMIKQDGTMEYAPEKGETVVRTLMKLASQHRGWDKAKLLKMVALNQELYRFDFPPEPGASATAPRSVFVIEDDLNTWLSAHPEVAKQDKVLVLGKDRLISYAAAEAVKESMATGLVDDLDGLFSKLGTSKAQVLDLSPSRSEEIAWVLAGFAPLLAAAAVLFLVLELKAPSGIWATLAVICGVLFFACQFYLQLSNYWEVLLIVAGIGLVVADLLWLPTGGMLSLAGGALALTGLLLAFMPDAGQFEVGSGDWDGALASALKQAALAMVVAAAGTVVAMLSLPRFAARSGMAAMGDIGATAADAAAEPAGLPAAGRRGSARTDLRPGGAVLVDGREFGATSEHGAFIAAGTPVEVVGMSFGELVVRPVQEA